MRRILWPKLLRLPDREQPSVFGLDTIHTFIPYEVYQQILKDVARSRGHLPSNATEEDIQVFQEQMIQMICWVLHRNPHLK